MAVNFYNFMAVSLSTMECDWVKFYDEADEQFCYHNTKSDEIRREDIHGKPTEYQIWEDAQEANFLKSTEWRVATDEKSKRRYFYNKSTKITTWQQPDVITEFHSNLALIARGRPHPYKYRGSVETAIPDVEIEIDPLELEMLATVVDGKDAILEPNIVAKLKRFRELTDEDASKTVETLSNNYVGMAPMVNIVAELLIMAKILQDDGKTAEKIAQPDTCRKRLKHHQEVEKILVNELTMIVKSKFDKQASSAADNIFQQERDMPAWLLDMLDDPLYRKMLIELYDQNPASALLGLCLKEINAKGHHREISRIVREPDFLEVYHDLLTYLMQRALTVDQAESQDLLAELRRNTCSAPHLFIYAHDMFQSVEIEMMKTARLLFAGKSTSIAVIPHDDAAQEYNDSNNTIGVDHDWQSARLRSWKIRTFKQEIENAVVWDKLANDQALDEAGKLALSILSPQLSRCTCHQMSAAVSVIWQVSSTNQIIVESLQQLSALYLKNSPHETSPACNKASIVIPEMFGCDQFISLMELTSELLAKSLDDSELFTNLLRHPQFVHVCIDQIVLRKNSSLTFTHDCEVALLLAVASENVGNGEVLAVNCVDEEDVPSAAESDAADHGIDFNRCLLSRQYDRVISVACSLMETRDILQYVDSMKFGGLKYDQPVKLIEMMQTAVISKCALRWVQINSTSHQQSSYFLVLPVMFQIILEAALRHPCQRPQCFVLLRTIWTELSSFSLMDTDQQMSSLFGRNAQNSPIVSLQMDTLKVIVCLMSTGYFVLPMRHLVVIMSDLDAVMVRHLLHLLLQALAGPYQNASFVHELIALFTTDSAIAALGSIHIMKEDLLNLRRFYQDILSTTTNVGFDSLIVSKLGTVVSQVFKGRQL